MQKKQVKPVKQATKAKSATKTSSKAAAKPAAKAPAKAAAKPASKPAAKAPAKAPAKPAAKAPAKAAPTASSNVTKPTRGAKAAPTQATMQAAARAASAATVGPRHRRDDRSADIPKPKQAPAVAPAIPSRAFSFEDAGRTFNCRVEPLRPSGTDAWWWFEVSTEQHQRHAPFRAEGDDTQEQVRARMVKYYDELLARRAEPAPNRWNRRPSSPGTPAVTAPAEDAEDAEGVDDAEGADLDGEEPNGDEPEMVDLSEAEGIAEESTT